MRDHKLVVAIAASTVAVCSGDIGWNVMKMCMCLCVFVFSRVREVFQAKLVHQEKEALLAGWDCQENKETPDLKGNQ